MHWKWKPICRARASIKNGASCLEGWRKQWRFSVPIKFTLFWWWPRTSRNILFIEKFKNLFCFLNLYFFHFFQKFISFFPPNRWLLLKFRSFFFKKKSYVLWIDQCQSSFDLCAIVYFFSFFVYKINETWSEIRQISYCGCNLGWRIIEINNRSIGMVDD